MNPDNNALEPQRQSLRRVLGVPDGVALLVGISIGAGIYSTPQIIAGYSASFKMVIALWIMIGIYVFIGGLIYAELGTRLPVTGGEYVYISRGITPFAGFMFGWSQLLIIRTSSVAALAIVTADYLGFFVHIGKFTHKAIAFSVILVLGFLNYIGLKQASLYQKISSLLKVLGLFIFVIAGMFLMQSSENLLLTTALPTSNLGPIGNLITPIFLIFFTYGGWDRVGHVAGEMKNPRRVLPLSLIFGISILIIIYALINMIYHRTLGIEGVRGSAVFASEVAIKLIGPSGAILVSLLVVISATGSINGNIMSSSRVYYQMAKDGLFFKYYNFVHPKFRTPSRAILIHCFWAAVILIVRGSFEAIITGMIFVKLSFYALSILALFRLRSKKVGNKDIFRAPLRSYLPVFYLSGLLMLLTLRVIFDWKRSLFDIGLVATGIPLYLIWSRRKGRG